ncbi:MAG: sugar ABC transporter permease [Oscillospiraceae bacterium]|jgi:arabinogalactan oligomer/maltooligosaccharide transport system permease protein|nr:sugar ABC transporter permease [Oscillospiraceae bacterium]
MHFLSAGMSAVIWGSGQFRNRQWLKGLFFLFVQALLVFTELITGTWNVLTGVAEGHFRNCGFFIRGIWGLVTLGEIPRTSSQVKIYDHSTMLMIGGLVAITLLIPFGVIYVINIRDAYVTAKKLRQGERVSSLSSIKGAFERNFEYISISPGLILMTFISLLPVLFSLLVVFTNYNTNNIPPRNLIDWVGFRTFADIFQLPIWTGTFVYLFVWTVIWAFLAAFTSYGAGLLQAMMINSPLIRAKKFFRGIYMLPWAIPAYISLLTFKNAFHSAGPINRFLLELGAVDSPIPFLSSTGWARACLVIVNMWLGFPYFMALISGVIATINPEINEAAEIDGASSMQLFRKITFPYIISATAPQIIFSVTFNFNNFGAVFYLTGGGPSNPDLRFAGATDILISWIYKLTVDQRMYNYAAAMSIFIFILLATFSGLNLRRTRAFKED